MGTEEYYGNFYWALKNTEQNIIDELKHLEVGAEHISARIKSPESAEEKLKIRNHPGGAMSAITNLTDIIGIRVIVRFIDEIYQALKRIKSSAVWKVECIKDYVKTPKANGYRSLHVLISFTEGITAEIQIRTIAQDCWASLEHEIKYKKENKKYSEEEMTFITSELKRCADEIASTDITMQTIKDKIDE